MEGVRILALDGAGRVLLVRHSYGTRRWMPPGGGIARGEDALAAASRELREETGCDLRDARLLCISGEDLHGASNRVHLVRGSALGVPAPDRREIVAARFFAPDALPPDMTQRTAALLERWLVDRPEDGSA